MSLQETQFPGSTAHGDAYRYFVEQTNPRAVGAQEKWLWFLQGWKCKGQQRVDVRSRK